MTAGTLTERKQEQNLFDMFKIKERMMEQLNEKKQLLVQMNLKHDKINTFQKAV